MHKSRVSNHVLCRNPGFARWSDLGGRGRLQRLPPLTQLVLILLTEAVSCGEEVPASLLVHLPHVWLLQGKENKWGVRLQEVVMNPFYILSGNNQQHHTTRVRSIGCNFTTSFHGPRVKGATILPAKVDLRAHFWHPKQLVLFTSFYETVVYTLLCNWKPKNINCKINI